jgi:transposase
MGLERLMAVIADREDLRIPGDARVCLEMLAAQLAVVKEQILQNDRRIRASARETEVGRRLMEIPGGGPLLASAFVASIADPTAFKSGRRAVVRSGSAASRGQATAICARCW